jgi:ParB-like chromosome segregation protein Spo0J
MRDNHFDPSAELVIAGIDTDDGPEHPCFDGESNAIPDDSPAIQGMKSIMLTDIGFFGAVTATTINGKRYVVAGRKRTRAARLANAERTKLGLPPMKIEVDHKKFVGDRRASALLELAAAENALRHNARSPLADVRDVVRMANAGSTVEQMALAKGVTANAVRRWQKIADLAPAVITAIEAGQISADAALVLHGLHDDEQTAKLARLLAATGGEAPSVGEAPSAAVPAEAAPADAPSRPGVAKRRGVSRAVSTERPAAVGKPRATISRADALAEVGGRPSRRGQKVIRRLMEMGSFVGSEEFRRGALWAIGDLSDAESGAFKKNGE